ncbi:MAG TPA: hypothetical protein VK043_01660, partial [Burkholderiales bacterium]|nr:hypothetical protein [Burkholderiales bacterium]
SHRAGGPPYTIVLLRAMILGMWSTLAFFLALALLLAAQGMVAFAAAAAVSLLAQWIAGGVLRRLRP